MDYRPRRARRRGGALWVVLLLAFPLGALVGYFLSSDPPVAALSADRLDFGEVRLGTTGGEQLVRVANQGEQGLWITSTVLAGEAAAEFRIAADGCAGVEVAARADCPVRVAFSPAARGPRRASLRLDTNAPGGAPPVALIGAGVAPELTVEPAALDLGSQAVGSTGTPATVRLGNRGNAALRLGRVDLVGRAARDFRRLADDCSKQELEPGEGCSLRYAFAPSVAGERRAALRIPSDAADAAVEVALVGRALDQTPVLRLDPERLDFGGLRVGEASAPLTVELANDGKGPLAIRGLRLGRVQDVAAGGAFELSAAACTGAEVPPGGSCEVEIRFRPVAEVSAAAILEIDTSAGREPGRVRLWGVGTAPGLSVAPARLSFGEVGVRATSPARGVRLASSGSGDLVIADVAVTGADAESFAAGADGCAAAALGPGGECTVEVHFRPRRPGPHRAELVLRHNAEGRSHRVPLNGFGVTARLSLDRQRIDFGEVVSGQQARQRLVLTNSGRTSLTVERLRLTGGRDSGFALDGDRCSGTILGPGEACAAGVRFSPRSPGAHSIRLAIDHSAGDRLLEVPVNATAVLPPAPGIRLEPAALELSERRVGERGPIRTLRVHNSGNGRLVLADVSLGGEHPGDFQLVAGSCEGAGYVAPGANCTLGVRFVPTAEGPRRASLLIRHNAGPSPARLALTGRGTRRPSP